MTSAWDHSETVISNRDSRGGQRLSGLAIANLWFSNLQLNPSASPEGSTVPGCDSGQSTDTYAAALKAIAECERVEQCMAWKETAAALASFAKCSNNDGLRVLAVRIQARAERRCGELLRRIPRGDVSTRFGQAGAVPPVNRTKAANQAGLSERQRKTALRISAIPEDEFNERVESSTPPTITQLAEQGAESRSLVTGTHAREELNLVPSYPRVKDFIGFCRSHEPSDTTASVPLAEVLKVQQGVHIAIRWLEAFVTNLPEP